MSEIKSNYNNCVALKLQKNANVTSILSVNNELLNSTIYPLNIGSSSLESSLSDFAASSIDRQTQIADFIVANAGASLGFSAGDRAAGNATDTQLKPQSQLANAITDPLTGTISASQLNFADPGNSIPTARNVVGVQNGNINLTEFVGTVDTDDFYRFELGTKSNFSLLLDGLSADADVELIQDKNLNGAFDLGEFVNFSFNSGTLPDTIYIPNLAPGTYYVQVYSYSGSTNYNLNLSATSIPVINTTTPNGVFNSDYGYGLVNANAAVSRTLNRPIFFPEVPNFGGNNWGRDTINAPEVWNQGVTGNGIVVAVIDSGVDYNHPDLEGNIWQNSDEIPNNGIDDDRNGYIDDIRGWDFVSNDNDPMDRDIAGHGTHIAGAIAAERNDFGITGVAYNAKIMPVRSFSIDGFGDPDNTAAGIRYAADNGANVINYSAGYLFPTRQTNEAIQYANNKGVVVVMSAGNDGFSEPEYPARNADRFGIAVGGIDRNGMMNEFSNRAGSRPLDYLVAPGVDIFSTTPFNTYESYTGTSMAAPHVAGVAALVLEANPTLTPAQVEYILTTTANSNGITV
jgi:subtilisin family serine protease